MSVDLTVASKTGALTVPSVTVRGASAVQPRVLVVQDGRVAERDVTLGLRGDGTLEITSGLEEGADVIVPDGTPLAVGQRVRASREVP